MSDSLYSGLDGPKWAPIDSRARLRSQSAHPERIPSSSRRTPSVSQAPRKPARRGRPPSVRLADSARKLFADQSPTVSSGPCDSCDNADQEKSSVCADSDTESTPRASRRASEHSFIGDFLPVFPPSGLVQDIVVAASAVTGAAVSLL